MLHSLGISLCDLQNVGVVNSWVLERNYQMSEIVDFVIHGGATVTPSVVEKIRRQLPI